MDLTYPSRTTRTETVNHINCKINTVRSLSLYHAVILKLNVKRLKFSNYKKNK